MELNDRQKRFCEEYLIDFNGTQAAIRAGYSVKTANEQAARLLANVSISEHINSLKNKLSEQTGITAQWVINRFVEISDRCMQAVPVMIRNDEGAMVESGEYKFDSNGANKATEMIGKHIGFFEADNGQKIVTININGRKLDAGG